MFGVWGKVPFHCNWNYNVQSLVAVLTFHFDIMLPFSTFPFRSVSKFLIMKVISGDFNSSWRWKKLENRSMYSSPLKNTSWVQIQSLQLAGDHRQAPQLHALVSAYENRGSKTWPGWTLERLKRLVKCLTQSRHPINIRYFSPLLSISPYTYLYPFDNILVIFLPDMLIDLEGSTVQGLRMKTQARLLRFTYRLCYSQALEPRASYLTFLCLSLSISEMGIVTATYP